MLVNQYDISFSGGGRKREREIYFFKKPLKYLVVSKKSSTFVPKLRLRERALCTILKSVIVWWYEVWYDYCRYVVDAVENE